MHLNFITRVLLVSGCLFLVPFLPACKPAPAPSATAPTPTPASRLSQSLDRLKDQAKETINELAKSFEAERGTYSRKLDDALKDLQPKIDELKKRAETATEQARPEIERNLRSLEEKSQRLRARLERLRSASEKGWEEFKKSWQKDDEEELQRDSRTAI